VVVGYFEVTRYIAAGRAGQVWPSQSGKFTGLVLRARGFAAYAPAEQGVTAYDTSGAQDAHRPPLATAVRR
jgi:hypothetical protein